MNDTAALAPAQANQETDLLDLLGILRRRKGLIALGLFLGVAAAALYYFLTPPTFRAEMEILVGQKSGDLVKGASSGSSVEGVDTEEDVLSTHIQLMTSRRIVAAAIKEHQLDKISSVVEAVNKSDSVTPLVYILDNLDVTKGGDGVARDAHTLKATYDDPSPMDCATILRAIFDEYSTYLKQHFEGTSTQAVDLLTQLANETGRDVREAEKQLADQLANSAIMWDGEKTRNIHKERLDKIEEDLHDLTETEAETASRLAVITSFLSNNAPNTVSDFDRLALLSEKEVNRLKLMYEVTRGDVASEAFQAEQPIRQATAQAEYDEYLSLVMKEKKLREKFSDGHPQIVSLREQIAMMRKFIDDNSAKITASDTRERMQPAEMLQTYVGLLRNDLAGLVQQREVLQRRSDVELAKAKELEQVEMQAESLRREMLRRQEVFEDTQDTLKELNFVRDYAGFSTDVIGDAEPQERPSWPKPIIVLALGLFAGGLLGFGMALLSDLMDTTFVDPDDVQRTLGAPVLAHVPRFEPIKRKRKDAPFAIDSSVRVHHQPRTPAAEVFRVLRTGLLVEARKNGHQVIQVTSPLPGDGKSTTSVNLAMAFAQTGKRTLIVDADLRKPRVARLLHLDGELGFAEALMDQCDPVDVVQTTVNENLFAVGAGSIPPNPSELLQSDRFSQLLNVWRDKFDFIIVDTPPVLAVSDAAVVSEEMDNVLLAVRIIKNGRKAAVRAADILRRSGSEVGAIIVNGYQTKDKSYGYSGGYDADAYGYGYGESHKAYYGDNVNTLQSV
ncbi:capsular exopolysaccharide synthesis family protein [Rhodopirellula rubra]|uniref:non-specific protein-tyrosine kinase n=1 Tax=Aporhodopirellula rubra TaxID=980271 RepID=A0A7W5H7D9_9BACT|nr:polysaccharide biosynthesis tyrosine autokinase [Aporhodopirellula rubra]MBB3208344.1 capsular exopolysaccharide synthesis family protein [Aporhodopirellula rubra]